MKFLNQIDGADKVLEDSLHRFVTDSEKSAWNAKQTSITGGATSIATSNLTTSRALISDSNGKVAASSVTSTELGYLDGVTSNVQTQISGKAPTLHTHTVSNITDFPSSMPANGGNADTVDGKHASAFALATQVLTDVPSGAKFTDTIYTHPSTHPATMITEDTSHRFVTDAEKSSWDAKGTSNLALGTTSATAYRGDYGNTAYLHSQTAHAPTNAQANQTISSGNGMASWTATSGNLTVAMGTPSTLTAATTNAVTSTSHSHSITTTSEGVANTIVQTDGSGNIKASSRFNFGGNAYMEYNSTTKSIDFVFV